MPSISCTVNQCMLTYYEGRGGLTEGWIAGYERVLDLRGVIVRPGPSFTPSFQITRYGYQPPAGFASDGAGVIEWLDDAITGGLRRQTDVVRSVLERTRGDITVSIRQQHLEERLRAYFTRPHPTLAVEEYTSNQVTVLGRVERAGVQKFRNPPTLAEVLANAGAMPILDKQATLTRTAIMRGREKMICSSRQPRR